MAYEYDIFLSYKRHPESRQWLVEHFQPLLEFHVELELGRRVSVFRDDQDDEAGTSWPAHLGRALGNSRTLVALWTRTYFHSEWCSRELSAMLARERDEQFRTAERPEGLIFPVVLHDCEQLPPKLPPMQSVAMQECFQVRMARNSQTAESSRSRSRSGLHPASPPRSRRRRGGASSGRSRRPGSSSPPSSARGRRARPSFRGTPGEPDRHVLLVQGRRRPQHGARQHRGAPRAARPSRACRRLGP